MFDLIAKYHLGDLSSIAGVVISVIGFAVTLIGVWRSGRAAKLAQQAAESTRNSIRAFETVIDMSGAIKLLEDLKAAHRNGDRLPERYSTLRKTLIAVRTSGDLSDTQSAALQAAIVDLRDMENAVERSLAGGTPTATPKLNG